MAEIAAANNVPGYGLIYVGWTLKIPAAATTTAKSANALNAVSQTYVVQPGEFLYQIAVRYGTTVQAIAAANNLPSDWLIFAGQRLNIPSKVTNSDLNPPNVGSSGGLNIRITNVPLYRQKQALTCEEASVAMASRGRVSEVKLVAAMPKSDNPFLGIRGRTNAPYYGGLVDYGAYAQALQTGLTKLGIRSEVLYGQPFEEFRESILYHLKAGRPVPCLTYDHASYARRVLPDSLSPRPVILLEGILILAEEPLRRLMDIKLFIDTDADVRILRRLNRDIHARGRSFDSVQRQYLESVRPMHLEFVEPSKRWADVIVPEGGENRVALSMVVARVEQLLGDFERAPVG